MTIFEYFSARTQLPISINEIIAAAKQHGGASEYNLYKSPLDPTKLRGLCCVYDYSDAPGEPIADIFYASSLADSDPYMTRVVVCKEITHTLDHDGAWANTEEVAEQLFKEMAMRPEFQRLLPATKSDYLGGIYALAILVPTAARLILKQKYEAGEVTMQMASDIARIPASFMETVLSDDWDDILKYCGLDT